MCVADVACATVVVAPRGGTGSLARILRQHAQPQRLPLKSCTEPMRDPPQRLDELRRDRQREAEPARAGFARTQ
jgi:hypothetical protein